MASDQLANKIRFHCPHLPVRLKRKVLKKFIARIFKIEKKTLKNLSVVFCSDDFLLKINQDYLKHNTYTDIITFDLSPIESQIQAEIYISIDRVKENAQIFNTTFSQELLRVIFHGILHLCGYKDKSKRDKIEIRAREDVYLKQFQLYVSRETRSTWN